MSNISSVSSLGYGSTALDTQARIPNQVLDQNDFLKLLVAQMTSQDPMEPQSNTEFVAQMASFTTLEQSKDMTRELSMLKASSLLGRTVDIQTDDQITHTGVVSAVHVEAGTPKLVVDGVRYTLDQLRTITPTVITNPTSTQ